ncbi:MAG: hypothetical protein LBM13_05640, partial [Candidatus Ancillula sp.]|nr:hypothetical protein [Candidatus Ancillula sp.]
MKLSLKWSKFVGLLVVLVVSIFAIITLASCDNNSTKDSGDLTDSSKVTLDKINLVVPDGAPVLPVANLTDVIAEEDYGSADNYSVDIKVASDQDALVAAISKDHPEAAIVGISYASKLFN